MVNHGAHIMNHLARHRRQNEIKKISKFHATTLVITKSSTKFLCVKRIYLEYRGQHEYFSQPQHSASWNTVRVKLRRVESRKPVRRPATDMKKVYHIQKRKSTSEDSTRSDISTIAASRAHCIQPNTQTATIGNAGKYSMPLSSMDPTPFPVVGRTH